MQNRIDFLDGIRGVSILLVIFYHAYSRWIHIVPYENQFASFPLFEFGFLGVQLFFLISGFVILMSLEKNSSLLIFLYKRWLRLFPAMLIVTVFLITTMNFFYEGSWGVEIKDIIPGLTFIPPSWFSVLGLSVKSLEGSFWSLYVEVHFYLVFGVLYFKFGTKRAVEFLSLIFLLSIILYFFHTKLLSTLFSMFSTLHYGWFASGCCFYLFFKTREKRELIMGLILLLISTAILGYQKGMSASIFCLVLSLVFILPIVFSSFRGLLTNKFLLFFGFISYPLYLIHEKTMIASVIKINYFFPNIPVFLLPLIPITLLSVVAYLISKFLEPKLKLFIEKLPRSFNERKQ